jgi:aryl carrier-like protein
MTSFRPEGDKEWNYVREHENLSPFLKWIPRGPNLFECCVLDGWPSKVQSNQPDKSYCTKDLFQPHSAIPKAWKYVARLDDTIVLVNGEKFNPVAMEGTIRSHKLVKEAVVYGTGRPYLGLLIVPASELGASSHQETVDALWPLVEAANQFNDAFAKIPKEMVTALPSNCDYPRTDKGSIIRQAFYRAFKNNIDDAYESQESGSTRVFNGNQLKDFLRIEIGKMVADKTETVEDDADIFHLGLDSLQAIQLRSTILRSVEIGGKTLIENVVFEYPSIVKLSNYLQSLQSGDDVTHCQPVDVEMRSLIEKYEIASQHAIASVVSEQLTIEWTINGTCLER